MNDLIPGIKKKKTMGAIRDSTTNLINSTKLGQGFFNYSNFNYSLELKTVENPSFLSLIFLATSYVLTARS